MIKININDNYIKILLKELDIKFSTLQMIIVVISTITVSITIGLSAYIPDYTNIIVSIVIFFLFTICIYLELRRNDLTENWSIKEAAVIIDEENKKLLDEYKVKIKGFKGYAMISYEDYKDLHNGDTGYAVVSEKSKKLLLWFDVNKYEYNKKC